MYDSSTSKVSIRELIQAEEILRGFFFNFELINNTKLAFLKFGTCFISILFQFNPLTPNDPYSGRTAPLTSKHCILYIYSTNTGIEYFKYGINSQFFSIQNAVCFIILTYFVPVLFTFHIQYVLKFKKIIPAPKA